MDYLIGFANTSTILLCVVCKVPQILAIFKAKSSKGVSSTSVMVELFGYSIVLGYNVVMKYDYGAYLEYVFLVLQDILLVLLLFYYQGNLDVQKCGAMGLFVAAFYGFTIGIPHKDVLPMLIKVVTPISASSKIIQLREILKTKNSQSVSVVTWLIAAYTCITRIFTTLVNTGDVPLLINYTIALILNSSIILSALRYRNNNTGDKENSDKGETSNSKSPKKTGVAKKDDSKAKKDK